MKTVERNVAEKNSSLSGDKIMVCGVRSTHERFVVRAPVWPELTPRIHYAQVTENAGNVASGLLVKVQWLHKMTNRKTKQQQQQQQKHISFMSFEFNQNITERCHIQMFLCFVSFRRFCVFSARSWKLPFLHTFYLKKTRT